MPTKLRPGTYKTINTKPDPKKPGSFRSTTLYGDHDGVSRQVQAFGPTAAAAEDALLVKLAAREKRVGAAVEPTAPVSAAAEFWYAYEVERKRLSHGSLETYRQSLDAVAKASHEAVKEKKQSLWNVPLNEVTTPMVDTFLNDIALESVSRAGRMRVVLSHTFAMGVRKGWASDNPVPKTKIDMPAPGDDEPEVLSMDELVRLRRAANEYMHGKRPGRPPTVPVDIILDVMVGAGGLRPGEALALLWEETDLDSDEPTTKVTGTIKTVSAKSKLGVVGTYRKPRPKTKKSRRQLLLDKRAAAALRRLPRKESGLVFATSEGTPISRRNFHRAWCKVRDMAGVPHAQPKMVRATVATLVDEAFGTRTASHLLGHAGEQVTRDSYIKRPQLAPDVRRILDELP